MRIKKKDLLKKIEVLEKNKQNIKDIRKREDLIFDSLISMYEHEVKYCCGITKDVYRRLIYKLQTSIEFRRIATAEIMDKLRYNLNFWG